VWAEGGRGPHSPRAIHVRASRHQSRLKGAHPAKRARAMPAFHVKEATQDQGGIPRRVRGIEELRRQEGELGMVQVSLF
jgi:hypothetical protein